MIDSGLRLVVDIQACVKAQQSRAYARKVAISNLQQKARSLAYIQSHGIGTLEKLKSACEDTERLYQEKSEELRQTRQKLASVNEQIHFLGQYLSGKKTYTDFLSAPDKAQFRSEHREEIDNYEAARTRLQEMFPDRTFPQIQTLKKERDRLQQSITHQRAELKPVSNQRKALRIVERNILSIFKDQSLLQARAVLKHDARLSP